MRTPIERVERSLHEVENNMMYLISDIQKLNNQSENRVVLLKSITDSLSALKLQLEHDYHQMHMNDKLKLEQEED